MTFGRVTEQWGSGLSNIHKLCLRESKLSICLTLTFLVSYYCHFRHGLVVSVFTDWTKDCVPDNQAWTSHGKDVPTSP